MSTKSKKYSKKFTYTQILEKYFPGDTIEMDSEYAENSTTGLSREGFFDVLKKANQPNSSLPAKGISKG